MATSNVNRLTNHPRGSKPSAEAGVRLRMVRSPGGRRLGSSDGDCRRGRTWGLLREGTLFLAGATAFAFMAGYAQEQTYFSRLGLAIGNLGFPPEYFLAKSFDILAMPVLLLVTLVLADAAISRVRDRHGPEVLFRGATLPAMAAIVAVFDLAVALSSIGDSSALRLPFGVTAGRSFIWVLAVAMAASIAWHQWPSANSSRGLSAMMGRTKTAGVWLGVAATAFLLGAAAATGMDAGNDAAWGCKPLPGISFNPAPPAVANQTVWLVARSPNAYIVRDAAEPPASRNWTAVQDHGVSTATLGWLPAAHRC